MLALRIPADEEIANISTDVDTGVAEVHILE